MKKLTLKNIAVILAASIMFSVTAYAECENEMDNNQVYLTEKQISEKNNAKANVRAFIENEICSETADSSEWTQEQYERIAAYKEEISRSLTYPSEYSITINHVQQINRYYCGPATAVMLLSLTASNLSSYSSSDAQDFIAGPDYLHTDSSGTAWYIGDDTQAQINNPNNYKMSYGLNYRQYYQHGYYEWGYVSRPKSTLDDVIDDVKFTVYMDYAVAVYGRSIYGTNSYIHNGYPTSPVTHWVVCNGWESNGGFIITDPASGISGFTTVPNSYTVTESTFYSFVCMGVVS